MKPRPFISAFSLLELLVVVAIIALLMVFTVPALNSALQSARLTQATQVILDQISLARQTAISKNRVVEVRLYRFAEAPNGTKKSFRALQSFELQDDGSAKALEKMRGFPAGIIIDSGASLSSLTGSSRVKQWTGNDTKPSLPGIGTDYDTYALRLRPDGSTDLASSGQPWFATLHYENSGDSLSALPDNFSMIQIDPWTSQAMLYRP